MGKVKQPKTRSTAGIDVAAKTLQVAFRGRNGEVVDLEFTNDAAGHQKLCLLFVKLLPARVCLEATSLYGLDLAVALHVAGVEVMIANPRAARRFMEAQMTRAKTDKVDARGLLAFVERMEFVPWTPPSAAVLGLRMLARRLHDVVCQTTAEENRLHAAQATQATPSFILDDIKTAIRQLEERETRLIAQAKAFIAADPGLSRAHASITTVKGIKDRAAIAILGELLPLPPEMTPRQVVAHAGLDPKPRESGTSVRGRNAISKIGNARLRGALFLPAMTASRFEPAVAAHYQRLIAGGKQPYVAYVAIMRKLLHSLWIMIQTGLPFDGAKYGPKSAVAP